MSEGWLEAVLRLNSQIAEGEARFNHAIEQLANMGADEPAERTSEAEADAVLNAHFRRLSHLRAVQSTLLALSAETK